MNLMQIIPGSTGIELAKEIAEIKGWEIMIPKFKTFSDGEQYLKLPSKPEKDVLIVQSLYHPQDSFLFQLINLVATVKRLGAQHVTVYVPYLAYARADREVLTGEAISSQTVLNLLESVGVDHLIVLDVHNPEIFNYTNKMKTSNIYPALSIKSYFEKHIGKIDEFQIVAPDAGAKDRAQWLGEALKIPYTHLSKQRDPVTNEVDLAIGEANITRKKIIMVDDIMATGSSLVKASLLLSLVDIEEINIVVTHALGTNSVDRLQEIGNGCVVATTSIPSAIAKISTAEDIVELLI